MDWDEVQLKDVAFYRNDKVKFDEISYDDYISTENMIADKGGVVSPSSIPTAGSSNIYLKSDILVSNIRPYFKKIWFANKEGSCSNDVLVFASKDEKIDKEFLYYRLSTDDFFDHVMAGSNGVKMPRGNKKSIMDYSFLIPPLKTQKKIASILSNYDKLIENNNQRIKLLESMAEEIYKEWFVRLRFPDTKIKEINIGEIVDLRQGFALNSKSKHYISEQGIPLLKISDLFKGTETLFVNDSIPKQFLVNEDEIIYTRTAQVGYVFMGKKGVIYNNCFKVIPKNSLYTTFIYYFLRLKSTRYLAQTLATGTAQADLNHDSFKGIKINYPNEKIVIKFNKIVEPMDKEIKNLLIKNKNLKETRDLLLPKLIHGTLKV